MRPDKPILMRDETPKSSLPPTPVKLPEPSSSLGWRAETIAEPPTEGRWASAGWAATRRAIVPGRANLRRKVVALMIGGTSGVDVCLTENDDLAIDVASGLAFCVHDDDARREAFARIPLSK